MFRHRNIFPRQLILLFDVAIVGISFVMAYLLRFNFRVPDIEVDLMPRAFAALMLVRLGGFLIARTYAGMIAYTSTEDAQRIFFTTVIGTLLLGVMNFGVHLLLDAPYFIPFSILLIDLLAELVLLTGYRAAVKVLYWEWKPAKGEKLRIVIHGAGEAGIITKRALEQNRKKDYDVVAFTETRAQLFGQKLEGVGIYDVRKHLQRLLRNEDIDQVVIATWEIPVSLKSSIVDQALEHKVQVLHVPPATQWINGELNNNQIRQVKIEELLERDPIQLHLDEIRNQVSDKVILVTGAAGSIGSEIARQLVEFNPGLLVLLDQAESPLYELDLELKRNFPDSKYEIVMGDIRTRERMENVFTTFKPQWVFHAAAYKHVPMMENNPSESILTNAYGTKICADLAAQHNVEKFVLVSTDKAVNPTNVMGASKRIAEMYVQSLDTELRKQGYDAPRFITTRFGNVLGSNGSVIPLFRKQIEDGGPVTVTHPEVTRYFMTIPEACQLVLEAGAMGNGGEIFIFDMGEPVKIADLARKMIALSGLEPDRDIKIEYSGLRPGEKLYEELLAQHENTVPTHHPKIKIAKVREYEH
ncbi:MAG TPA: nucleoside-diphosphate sugar epimerase/dehydratase, partial [Chitinophagales bacterium]|nr:nucleoside-diphosphate sugar epimerase/dehydratase [Chitinophagales bacterium]